MRTVLRMALHHLGEQLRPVHAGHHHVGDDDIHAVRGHEIERHLPVVHEIHFPFVPHGPQLALQTLQHPRLVVHKQKRFHAGGITGGGGGPASGAALVLSGRRMMKVVPRPISVSNLTLPPCRVTMLP